MRRLLCAAGAGVVVLALGACSQGDAGTAPSALSLQLTAVDSSLVAVRTSSSATISDVDMLNGISTTMGWSLGDAPTGLSYSLSAPAPSFSTNPGSGCTYNVLEGRFDCPPQVNARGVTVVRSLAFFDVNGTPMDHFDSTTASINVQSTENGVIAEASGADTLSGSRNLTATGLLGHNATRIWNGTASGTVGSYWSDSAATRTADVSYTATFSNVVVALPRSANPYPVSGSITRIVTGTGVVTKGTKTKNVTISRTVVITFNGTEFAALTVAAETYTLDLATGKATKD